MSLNVITFALFMVIAMSTYVSLDRLIEKRFGKEVSDTFTMQAMLILISITMPNAIATVLLVFSGWLLGR